MKSGAANHFFLIGGYSGGNSGDEAILKSTIYTLDELLPRSHFSIWTDDSHFTPRFDRKVSHKMVRWPVLGRLNGKSLLSKILTKGYVDLYPLSRAATSRWASPPEHVTDALRDADRVLFIGGGYLNSYYNLIQMNALSSLAQRMGKEVVLLGQTLGPFNKPAHAQMASEIFRNAKNIVLRDEESHKEVRGLGEKVISGMDDVIGFKPKVTAEIRRRVNKYFIRASGKKPFYLGLSLRRWEDSRRHYPALAAALDEVRQAMPQYELKVLFIPMEIGKLCDDRQEAEALRRLCPAGLDFKIVREHLSVEAKFHLFSQLDALVSMRLHALIFSMLSGIPSVGLYSNEYYFRKIHGVLRIFGMDRHALPLDRIERLPENINNIVASNEDLKAGLLQTHEQLASHRRMMLETVVAGGAR